MISKAMLFLLLHKLFFNFSQYLILMLDTRIVNSGGHGVAIFKACEALGIQYITKEQTVPFSITWNRQVTSINVSRENQVNWYLFYIIRPDATINI